jgi:enoyl-CoA hydratase/carnithine racemase
MTNDNVVVEKRDHFGIITLNRPTEMNTFTVPFARELNRALWEMEKDDQVRVVILKGAGKHFPPAFLLLNSRIKATISTGSLSG